MGIKSREKENEKQAAAYGQGGNEAEHYEDTGAGKNGDGKKELLEEDSYHLLGYSKPTWRKWQILTVSGDTRSAELLR